MWNLKRLPSNVLLKVNLVFEENVRMATKKAIIEEKPKPPKRGFFRRSESVMPDNYTKNSASDVSSTDAKSDESDSRRVIRRSSMICSEGFDKYTFDCHRRDIPHRSAGLDSDAVPTQQETVQNQSIPVPENDVFANARPSKQVTVEHSAIRKLSSPFNPLSAVSTSLKNAPLTFKRVPEETIPANVPLSYKRVPEETIPMAKITPINSPSNKSPVTAIPLSFSPVPDRSNWNTNTSPMKTSPIKSAPVKSSPFSFKQVPQESAPVKNSPYPFKQVPQESAPVRNAPLSFKHIPEKSQPVNKALSFRSVSDQLAPKRNAPLSLRHASDDFNPGRTTPLSFKHPPKQNMSSNYISDESMPVRNAPLSLKQASGESVSLRNIPLSLMHYPDEPSTPSRSIPLSLQTVPEEPTPIRESPLSYKNVPDQPIPFRNSPLSLKPILTKHISLLKKKTPSVKNLIIKRDSVVHPGRIDMQSSLFIDGRFQNPWPTYKPPTFTNVLKFGITRNKSKVPPKQELDLILPIVKQNFSKLSVPDDGIRVTWIGHSTVLIQMHGLNILTDPMFSDRASPSQVVGPKRYRDPPCTIHDLPHINAVVISHSHYDHLDHNTITLLNARFGSDTRWFVPLGLQAWMQEVGCENVVELDWWEENCVPEHSETFFVFTPAQHWSKRGLGDDNKVLWGSWCVLGPKYKFFFAGDTGYCEVFKQIGRVHGPFDLSAIPIGAYEPRWFMKYQHVNPEEAVKIHMDVKSKRSLAIHWGTFSLANEYYLDPPVKLRESLDKNEIPPELFFTLKHGESRLIAQNNLVKKYPLSERNMNNT